MKYYAYYTHARLFTEKGTLIVRRAAHGQFALPFSVGQRIFIGFKDMKSQSIKNFEKKKIYEKFEQVMHLMDDPKFPGAAAPLNRYWI